MFISSMKKYIIFILLVFTLAQTGLACRCTNLSKEIVNEIYDYHDYAFTGTVISGDFWDSQILNFWNSKSEGHHVYMRIDSVLKGDLEVNQVIYIYQASNGCIETFEYNTKKLIFGRAIKKLEVINHDKEEGSGNSGNLPPPNPNEFGLEENGTYKINNVSKKVSFLQAKLEHYTVIDTNMCGTFNSGSKLSEKIIAWLKN